MGQTVSVPPGAAAASATTPLERPPAKFEVAAAAYAVSAGFGAILGTAMNLIMPSTRRTRKEAMGMAALASGMSLAGYLLNLGFGEKGFFSSMIRVGGLFTGNAVSDLLMPGPKKVCMTVPELPKLAGWRR
jgi:hypothetical protein